MEEFEGQDDRASEEEQEMKQDKEAEQERDRQDIKQEIKKAEDTPCSCEIKLNCQECGEEAKLKYGINVDGLPMPRHGEPPDLEMYLCDTEFTCPNCVKLKAGM